MRHPEYWEYGRIAHHALTCLGVIPYQNPDKSESGLQSAVGHSQARSRLPAGYNQLGVNPRPPQGVCEIPGAIAPAVPKSAQSPCSS